MAGWWQNQPTYASWQKDRCLRSKAQRLGRNGCRAICSCSPFLFFQQHLSVTVCQVKCVAIILFSFFFVFHESLTLCRSLSCFCHFSLSRYHLPSKMSECIMSPWLLLLWAHFTFIDEFCFECFCWFLVVVFFTHPYMPALCSGVWYWAICLQGHQCCWTSGQEFSLEHLW